jgi:hypothetical protein
MADRNRLPMPGYLGVVRSIHPAAARRTSPPPQSVEHPRPATSNQQQEAGVHVTCNIHQIAQGMSRRATPPWPAAGGAWRVGGGRTGATTAGCGLRLRLRLMCLALALALALVLAPTGY